MSSLPLRGLYDQFTDAQKARYEKYYSTYFERGPIAEVRAVRGPRFPASARTFAGKQPSFSVQRGL